MYACNSRCLMHVKKRFEEASGADLLSSQLCIAFEICERRNNNLPTRSCLPKAFPPVSLHFLHTNPFSSLLFSRCWKASPICSFMRVTMPSAVESSPRRDRPRARQQPDAHQVGPCVICHMWCVVLCLAAEASSSCQGRHSALRNTQFSNPNIKDWAEKRHFRNASICSRQTFTHTHSLSHSLCALSPLPLYPSTVAAAMAKVQGSPPGSPLPLTSPSVGASCPQIKDPHLKSVRYCVQSTLVVNCRQ